MNTRIPLHAGVATALFTLALGFATTTAHANDEHPKAKPAATDSADAKTKAAYPLTTCVVSGENLEGGDMGGPFDYIHKEAGKPDRLVRFCCKSCLGDFKEDPAKYLKMIDDAAAAKAKG